MTSQHLTTLCACTNVSGEIIRRSTHPVKYVYNRHDPIDGAMRYLAGLLSFSLGGPYPGLHLWMLGPARRDTSVLARVAASLLLTGRIQ